MLMSPIPSMTSGSSGNEKSTLLSTRSNEPPLRSSRPVNGERMVKLLRASNSSKYPRTNPPGRIACRGAMLARLAAKCGHPERGRNLGLFSC